MARASNPEALYLSALLRTKDHSHPQRVGLDDEHFDALDEEWKWVRKYIKRHGRTPSKIAFKQAFPSAIIYKVDELDHYADRLHEEHQRRVMIETLSQAADQVASGSMVRAQELLAVGSKRLSRINGLATGSRELSLVDDWAHTLTAVEEKYDRYTRLGKAGVPFGFSTLDAASGGAQPGELWTVAARLGVGKSWCLMRMAMEAIINDHRVLYCALEQSRGQVSMRMHGLLSRGQFNPAALNRGDLKNLEEYKEFVRVELRKLVKGQMTISDQPRITPSMLEGMIERGHPDIIYVDYLTLMRSQSGSSKDWQSIGELSSELKALAETFDKPVVTAAQINRAGASNKETPGTEHLAYADAVGQDSDGVVTMSKRSRRVMKVKLAKYRNGPDGQEFWAKFDPGKGTFEEINANLADKLLKEDQAEDDED